MSVFLGYVNKWENDLESCTFQQYFLHQSWNLKDGLLYTVFWKYHYSTFVLQ